MATKASPGPRTFVEALEAAIAHSSLEVLCDETQLYSLMTDFLGNSPQSRQTKNLLRNAISCGIPERIYSAVGKDAPTQSITIAACRKLLMDNYCISEEIAGQFIQDFATALGWEVKMELSVSTPAPTSAPAPALTPTPAPTPAPAPASTPATAPAEKAKPQLEEMSPSEQNNLGLHYYTGARIGRNYAEAVKWFRKAAERGHSGAQANLGICYLKGEGVVQDYAEAVVWLQKAAVQGLATAQTLLGNCYSGGKGVKQDDVRAASWFQKAAEQGDASGQFNLGFCYYYGEGVPKNLKTAKIWLKKAAAQGNESAQKLLIK